MGVRKHKTKHKPQPARPRLAAPQRQDSPWAFTQCKLTYLIQPFHLRANASGAIPLSKLPTTPNVSRFFQKPLKLYRGQLKEVQTNSTA